MEQDIEIEIKKAIRLIGMNIARGQDLEELLGEVLATLRLNYDKGSLVVSETPTMSYPTFKDILDKWEQRYAKLRSIP